MPISAYRRSLLITEMQYGEETYTVAIHEDGSIYTKAELIALCEQASVIYSKGNASEDIRIYNLRKQMEYDMRIKFQMRHDPFPRNKNNGLFIIPKADTQYKNFEEIAKKWKVWRKWSVTCSWCGCKLSNTKDDGYYTFAYKFEFGFGMNDRACSEACANLLWREALKNWVKDGGYSELFDFEYEEAIANE